jgi:hypothetical protein
LLINLFKGTVARDFRPSFFFHQSTPPRALIHGLKPLCIWPNFRLKIENIRILAGSMTPLKPILTTFEAIISANTKPYEKHL